MVLIIGMHQSSKSITEITFKMGLCRNTVSKWINRWGEAGDLLEIQISRKCNLVFLLMLAQSV